jgi:hypothetical protein
MMRHTSAIVAVPSQADTRFSSIGVTWSTNALGACSSALDCKTAAESWSDRASFPSTGAKRPWRTSLYVQRDVMRMPEPEEFRRFQPRRATPFPPNLAFPTPNLDPRGFSRASSTSSWEMQLPLFRSKTDWTHSNRVSFRYETTKVLRK